MLLYFVRYMSTLDIVQCKQCVTKSSKFKYVTIIKFFITLYWDYVA